VPKLLEYACATTADNVNSFIEGLFSSSNGPCNNSDVNAIFAITGDMNYDNILIGASYDFEGF
jgi:hypothetical protein